MSRSCRFDRLIQGREPVPIFLDRERSEREPLYPFAPSYFFSYKVFRSVKLKIVEIRSSPEISRSPCSLV
jgi:hypothetical protein